MMIRNNPVRDFHGYADKKATAKKIVHDVDRKGDCAFRSGEQAGGSHVSAGDCLMCCDSLHLFHPIHAISFEGFAKSNCVVY